jgi:hypothetical protein
LHAFPGKPILLHVFNVFPDEPIFLHVFLREPEILHVFPG